MKAARLQQLWPPRSLRAQLFIALALIGLLPLGLLGFSSAVFQRQAVADQSTRELTGLARGLAGELDTYVDGLLNETRTLASLPGVRGMEVEQQREVLTTVFLNHPAFTRLSIFDASGQRQVSSHPGSPPGPSGHASFSAAERGQQAWELTPLLATGRPSLVINTPIRDEEHRVVGVLGAVVDLQTVSEVLGRVPIGGGGRGFVLGPEGQVLLAPAAFDLADEEIGRQLNQQSGGRPVGPGTARYEADGEARIAGFAPLSSLGWTVVVDLPEAEVLAPAERSWQLAIVGLLATAGLALLAATLLARRLTRRLKELTTAAVAFGQGDSAIPLPALEASDGELGILIDVFGKMREAVSARQASLSLLVEVSRELAASLDYDATLRSVAWSVVPALADWCLVDLVSPDGEIRRVEVAHANPDRAELAEKLRQYPPDPRATQGIGRVITTGEPELTSEYSQADLPTVTRNEEHLRLTQSLGGQSRMRVPLMVRDRMLGVMTFISAESGHRFGPDDLLLAEEIGYRAALAIDHADAYHQAREAIRTRDEFLSIAAHELRTPITVIRSAAQLSLRNQMRGTVDQRRLARSLGMITEATERLSVLIGDLLDVSRIQMGRLPIEQASVDLALLIDSVVEYYSDQLEGRHELTVEADAACPPVQGDGGRLEQVLTNLIDNAIKYSPDGGPIRIGLRPDGEGLLLTIRDAGIGLPAGVNALIFQPFGRAANGTERQIEGLGLGLYICHSIVERHGGRIWAESPGVGEGTAMHVWLPAVPVSPAPRPVASGIGAEG